MTLRGVGLRWTNSEGGGSYIRHSRDVVTHRSSQPGTRLLPLVLLVLLCAAILFISFAAPVQAQDNAGADQITFEAPKAALVGIPFTQKINATGVVE